MGRNKLKVGEERLEALFTLMLEELKDVGEKALPEETRFAHQRLVDRMRKRAKIHRAGLKEQSIADFIATNRSLDNVELSIPPGIRNDAALFISRALEDFTTLHVGSVQEPLDVSLLLDRWRFGPGASQGVTGTHAAEKIDQKFTTTFLAKPLVQLLRRTDPYFSYVDSYDEVDGCFQVRGSRLATVLKNETTMRTIAIEPSGNMCLQLAAGSYLEEVLRFIGLDIRNQQDKNKVLAWIGSVTGEYATIDLSKASDMLTVILVRLLWPREWFDLFMAIRSHEIKVGPDQWEAMRMMGTMGNGFTFPMMTLTLVALIYAFRASRGGPNNWIDWRTCAVFGDDIIVKTEEFDGVCELLHQAGLVVNMDKSYVVGGFRESCGGDYYYGEDVTPVYVKSLECDSDVYVVINQLIEWGSKHRLPFTRSIALLVGYLKGEIHIVPEWHGPEAGIRAPSGPRRYKFLKPKPVRVRYVGPYAMKLVVGGYLSGGVEDKDLYYTPRPYKTEWQVSKARIPKGYLDGADPLTRSSQTSNHADFIVGLILHK